MKQGKKQKKNQKMSQDDPDLQPLNQSENASDLQTEQGDNKNRSQQKINAEDTATQQSSIRPQQQVHKRKAEVHFEDNENPPDEIVREQSPHRSYPHRHEEKADVWNATVNMVKGFIGIGILTLPSGFAKSGWLGGTLLFLICGTMVLYLSQQMMDAANKRGSNARSATQFSMEVLGIEKELLVNIFLFGIQIGICVAYVIFFTTYFQESLCFFVDYNRMSTVCGSRVPSLIISLILVTPTIFIRHMSKLKTWSMFSNGLIIVSIGVVTISCFFKMDTSLITSDKVSAIRWGDLGNAIGLFVFAFEGTTLYFEIRSSMSEPTDFKKVLNYALGFGLVMYGLVGLSGYLAFGSNVRDIILFNFPMTNPLYVFIQIFYCIAILLSYPLQMFPLVNIMEVKLLNRIVEQKNAKKNEEQRNSRQSNQSNFSGDAVDQENVQPQHQQQEHDHHHQSHSEISEDNAENQLSGYSEDIQKEFYQQSMILRVCSMIFVFFVAIVFKKLTVFLNLIGSVGGCFFAFILPVVVYEYSMPEASQKKILFHRILLGVGVFFCFLGTISSISAIYKSL